jgi:hypothetical protein
MIVKVLYEKREPDTRAELDVQLSEIRDYGGAGGDRPALAYLFAA